MPYRRRGNRVEKLVNGRWVLEKAHATVEKAIRHWWALKKNVMDKE